MDNDKKEEKKDAMTPLSLEEIIDAKKAKEEELSKPKFLTKAERAQNALERRQKEAEEKRKQMDELRAKQKQIFQQVFCFIVMYFTGCSKMKVHTLKQLFISNVGVLSG